MLLRFLICLLVLFFSVAHAQPKEARVALVIGNSAYKTSPLRNPVNDAKDMATKLRGLGFVVVERSNLTIKNIGGTLNEFRAKLTPGSVALVFYAGHGLQIKGENYLPAVDAEITGEYDVPNQSLAVRQIMDVLADAKTRLNLVFLDACRNNPYARTFRSASNGLAKENAPSGTLISYATRPGSVAADGAGRNGLYTSALLEQMGNGNQPIEQALKKVVTAVKAGSGNKQEPWMEGSIEGEFCFGGCVGTVVSATSTTPAVSDDRALWDAVKDSRDANELGAYLNKFPKGVFSELATMRVLALQSSPTVSPTPVSVPTATPAPIARPVSTDIISIAGPVLAQTSWPTKAVKIVVPFAPGGMTDILARAVAPELSKAFGQPFIVDNRAGTSGSVGSDIVAKSPADGYTLLVGTVYPLAINKSLYSKLPFDPQKDFAPITLVAAVPSVMVMNAVKAGKLGINNVADFVKYAKAHPDQFSMASSGSGSFSHLAGEMFRVQNGLFMTHIPYRGSGPALVDLIGGSVDVMFDSLPSAIPHIKSGKLKALAVTSAQRSAAMPELPTVEEAGKLKGFEASIWFGLLAPAGTPPDVVSRIQQGMDKALATPAFKEKILAYGAIPSGNTPQEFARMIDAEITKWALVVKTSGAKVD